MLASIANQCEDQDHNGWQDGCRVKHNLPPKQGGKIRRFGLAVQLKAEDSVQDAGQKKRKPCGADHVFDVVKDAGLRQLAD